MAWSSRPPASELSLDATMPAAAREAPMTHDIGFDRRYLDLVVFTDQFKRLVVRKHAAALFANIGLMVVKRVGTVGEQAAVRLVPGLCPARTRVVALLFLVRRRGLGRGTRSLIRPLKPKHQLNQLLLAELLQITAIHPLIDSDIASRRKPWVIAEQ